MKRVCLIVVIISMVFCLVGCGKSKEPELADQYEKEELIGGYFAPCFKETLESLKMIDVDYFANPSETYVLEKYGKPSSVGTSTWSYDLSDGYTVALWAHVDGSKTSCYDLTTTGRSVYSKVHTKHPEAVMSDNYDQIKDIFDERGDYLYGFADYKYTDFVELFGNAGTVSCAYLWPNYPEMSSIKISWAFENGKLIKITFKPETGELYVDTMRHYEIVLRDYLEDDSN